MIARLLRRLIVMQGLSILLLTWLLVHFFGASFGHFAIPLAFLVSLLLALIFHAAFIAFNFAVSRRKGSPVPKALQLSCFQSLKMFDAEFDSSIRGFYYAHPFRSQRPTPQALPVTQPWPILCIHGFFCNRALWHAFMHAAAQRGFACEAITLEPPFASIDAYAETIENAVEALRRTHDAEQVILVCHSMGGLAVRAWVRRYGDAKAAHIITLGTPHHGSYAAHYMGHHQNVFQMQLESDWLRALNTDEVTGSIEDRNKITSIYSHHDNLIAPQYSSHLPGANNLAIGGYGHLSLVYSPKIWELIFAAITRLDALHEAEAEAKLQ